MAAGAKDPVVLYVSGGNTQVRLPEALHGQVHGMTWWWSMAAETAVARLPAFLHGRVPLCMLGHEGGLSIDLPGQGVPEALSLPCA